MGEVESAAGRPRPLRSRNDIKVFQEPRTRYPPFWPTSPSPHTVPCQPLPAQHSLLRLLGVSFLRVGGFQGCGVPINNFLSLSLPVFLFLYLSSSLSLSLSVSLTRPFLRSKSSTHLNSIRIRQKWCPFIAFHRKPEGGSSQNGDHRLLQLSQKSNVLRVRE